jgi:hypothetical protein
MLPADDPIPAAIRRGEECAWCRRPFVQAHDGPVVCQGCYDRALATRQSFGLLPLARHPLKAAPAS